MQDHDRSRRVNRTNDVAVIERNPTGAAVHQNGLAGATLLQVVPAMQDDAVGRGVLDLAIASLRRGARALVAAGPGALVGELQASGGEWTRLDFSKSGLMGRRRAAQALDKLVRAENVDIVHAYGPLAAACAVAATKRTKANLVTTFQAAAAGGWTRNDPQTAGRRVITLSHYAADQLERRYPIARDKVVVIPPIVDTGWFDPSYVSEERIVAVRESWRVRPEAQVVLLPGRLTPSQGHQTLIEASRILLNGGLRGVVFVIAGEVADTAYANELDDALLAHGLAPIFRRVGRSADMAAAYAACDVVALPLDHADVFSIRATEAQAMGCPVVASAIGALPEAMIADDDDGGRTGWLTQPHDALALARGLAGALSLDRRERNALAGRARAFTQRTFSPQHVTAATLAVYDEVLQESGTAAR